MPIAQQDAGYFQQRGLQAQQGGIQQQLYEQQGEISKQLAAQGFTHETAMAIMTINARFLRMRNFLWPG